MLCIAVCKWRQTYMECNLQGVSNGDKVKSDLHDGPSLDLTRLPSNAQGLVSYLHTLITLAGSSEQSRVLDEYKYLCIIYNLIILTDKCTQILFDVKYTLYIFLLSTVYSHDLGRPKCISMFCVCLPVLILIRCKYSLSTHTHTYSQLLKCASCSTSIPFHMRNCTH